MVREDGQWKVLSEHWNLGTYAEPPSRPLAEVEAELASVDVNRRAESAQALGQYGRPAVPALRRALQDPAPDVRAAAADALDRLGSDAQDAGPRLLALPRTEKDFQVRLAVRNALSAIGSPVVPGLIEILREHAGDAQEALHTGRPGLVWGDAVDALKLMGDQHPAVLSALVPVLREDPQAEVRAGIVVALRRYGMDALPALIGAAEDSAVIVRRQAIVGLGISLTQATGPIARKAVPVLVQALGDPDQAVRLLAASTLGRVGEPAKEVVPTLVEWLRDPAMREAAAEALRYLGPVALEAVPALLQALRDPSPDVRFAAAEALGGMSAAADEVVPALVATLRDPAPEVRRAAADALGWMEPAGAEVAAVLAELLQDRDPGMRMAAANALARLGTAAAAATPALLQALRDPEVRVRYSAIEALQRLGPAARQAIPALRAIAASDPDPISRQLAQRALEAIENR